MSYVAVARLTEVAPRGRGARPPLALGVAIAAVLGTGIVAAAVPRDGSSDLHLATRGPNPSATGPAVLEEPLPVPAEAEAPTAPPVTVPDTVPATVPVTVASSVPVTAPVILPPPRPPISTTTTAPPPATGSRCGTPSG